MQFFSWVFLFQICKVLSRKIKTYFTKIVDRNLPFGTLWQYPGREGKTFQAKQVFLIIDFKTICITFHQQIKYSTKINLKLKLYASKAKRAKLNENCFTDF